MKLVSPKQIPHNTLILPSVGQGMGEYSWNENQKKIIRAGIELGMNFIDTAEEYDKGHSEEIIGQAIKGIRNKVIIGTKFSPYHSSFKDVIKSAEASLKRLKTDYIDLYQLHWPNPVIPLEETLSSIQKLVKDGKVRYIGVCNLLLKDLQQVQKMLNKFKVTSLQIEYNIFDSFIEQDILPYCQKNNIYLIAYSPLDKGKIVDGKKARELIENLAIKYGKTPAQIALAWLISKSNVIPIPKAARLDHLILNAQADSIHLLQSDIKQIDKVSKKPLVKIRPDQIQVSQKGEGNRKIYQTLSQALANKLNFTPSPSDLSKTVKIEQMIKPVRLVATTKKNGLYKYYLMEGRIRYWAWVIAFGDRKPIPAYIREDWEGGLN